MRIERFAAFGFPVPFKTVFRHAQGSRRRAENLIVAAYSVDGAVGYGEGCPRRYVTGETVVGCLAFVREQADDLAARVTDAASLQAWIETKRCSIDRNPAAFCALEIAILDLIGKTEGRSLEAVAGVSPLAAAFHYSAVLGDAPPWLFRAQLRRYWRRGLRDFKVKLSDDAGRDQRKLAAFAKKSGRIRVRLDANNLWADVRPCVRHVAALRTSVFAIEEPLQVGDLAGFRAVGRACEARIILDESLLRAEQLDSIDDPERWIVNLRVSKMGGVLRTLTVAAKAQQRGIGVIVGCQVGGNQHPHARRACGDECAWPAPHRGRGRVRYLSVAPRSRRAVPDVRLRRGLGGLRDAMGFGARPWPRHRRASTRAAWRRRECARLAERLTCAGASCNVRYRSKAVEHGV